MRLSRLFRSLLFPVILILLAVFAWKNLDPLAIFKPEEKVTVSHNTVLTKVEALGKMELVRYKFKDVVEYKKSIQFFPDSRSVLIISGEAVGCINRQKLTDQDLVFNGDSLLTVYLPNPESCYSKVNHKESKILLMENTYFRDAPLVDEAYKYAEKNIARSANHSGILKQTEI